MYLPSTLEVTDVILSLEHLSTQEAFTKDNSVKKKRGNKNMTEE